MEKLTVVFEKEYDDDGNHWFNYKFETGQFFSKGSFTVDDKGKTYWDPEEKDGTDYRIFEDDRKLIKLLAPYLTEADKVEKEILNNLKN